MDFPSFLIKNTAKPSFSAISRPSSIPRTYIAVAQASASTAYTSMTVTEAASLGPSPQIWSGFLYSPEVATEIPLSGASKAM